MATSTNTTVGGTALPSSTTIPPSTLTAPVSTLSVESSTTLAVNSRPTTAVPCVGEMKVLDKRRIDELVKEVDPMEQLDEEVEEMLLQIADDFIDSVVSSSCLLAKHRNANTLEVKDVQLQLERNWNMWIPGYGTTDEGKPFKKSSATEAHKQRMALIKKTLKKF